MAALCTTPRAASGPNTWGAGGHCAAHARSEPMDCCSPLIVLAHAPGCKLQSWEGSASSAMWAITGTNRLPGMYGTLVLGKAAHNLPPRPNVHPHEQCTDARAPSALYVGSQIYAPRPTPPICAPARAHTHSHSHTHAHMQPHHGAEPPLLPATGEKGAQHGLDDALSLGARSSVHWHGVGWSSKGPARPRPQGKAAAAAGLLRHRRGLR